MCSLFKKKQRGGWIRNCLAKDKSNTNLTQFSLFGDDITIDEMRGEEESDGELGSGLRNQQLVKKKIRSNEKKNKHKPKMKNKIRLKSLRTP